MPGKRALAEAQNTTRKRRRTGEEAGAQSSHATHLVSMLDFHGNPQARGAGGGAVDGGVADAPGRGRDGGVAGGQRLAGRGRGGRAASVQARDVGGGAADGSVGDAPGRGRDGGVAGGQRLTGRGRGGRAASVQARDVGGVGKEVGLRVLRVVETGGHIMFLVMVFMPCGQLKMVAASKVLAVTSALQLKMLALVARQRHQDEKTPLVQIEARRNKYYASQ
uniref:Uncharacterized protein n=1 Tax=Phytophthora ramorum TaxID=164328 RepID=H3GET9_PHYRM